MKALKHIAASVVMLSLVHCASKIQLQDKAPTEIEEAYVQRWNSGIEEGNSGVNFYIKTAQVISFDSLYWRENRIKLTVSPNNTRVHVGSFKSDNKLIKAEGKTSKMPFQLKEDEAVISYFKNGKRNYFKIQNITERKTINYPSSHSIKQ